LVRKFLQKIKKRIKDEEFYPSLVLGKLINPFYFSRIGLLENIRHCSQIVTGKVLDIGCGRKPYKKIFPCKEYIGLEIDTPETRRRGYAEIFYDGKTIPADSGSFDCIIMSQVLEHVFNPDSLLQELWRVLKNEGHLLLTVPFIWDEHEQPFDYARYTSFGIDHLLQKNGFRIIEKRKTLADTRVIFQLINAYLYKVLMTKNNYVNLFISVFFMSPVNVLGAVIWRLLPRNPDLYLDNVVCARKV
jgi:SAM-dependent methyltransferase